MLLFTLWRCWHNRNELVHNKIPAPMDASRQYLCSYLESLIAIAQNSNCDPVKGKAVISYDPAVNRPHEISRIVPPAKWLPPPVGWVKLNTDGSWTNDGRAGAGMVLRDNLGNIIYSSCRELFSCRDALEAEICACMEGFSIAIQRTELPICIEMDSLIAVNMLKDKDIDRSIYASLVAEIKYLKSLRTTRIAHINRGQNLVSDFLASFARTESRTVVWLGSGPPEVIDLCKQDCTVDA